MPGLITRKMLQTGKVRTTYQLKAKKALPVEHAEFGTLLR